MTKQATTKETVNLVSDTTTAKKSVSYNPETMRVVTKTNSATFISFHNNGMATIATTACNGRYITKRYLVK